MVAINPPRPAPMNTGSAPPGSASKSISGARWPPPCSGRASVRSYFSSERLGMSRRASGSGRSASLVIGTVSRSLSVLHIAGSGAWASSLAWGCSSDLGRPPSPRRLDHAYHCLAARMHMDMLNSDFLLALAAVTIEHVEQ
jgi:hypothetical protein